MSGGPSNGEGFFNHTKVVICIKNYTKIQGEGLCTVKEILNPQVVVVLGFYVPPTAVIRRRDLGLKSRPKGGRSPGSNSRPLVYMAVGLTTTPRRLLIPQVTCY